MNGILNIYKEPGYTSHDVINRLRRICSQKKIGHTGTLDPNAEGVLPVCFGNATKICGLLTDTDKCYRAELILGKETDTCDITGTVISEKNVFVNETELKSVIMHFIGTIKQIPPMYSARKYKGQRLYDLARQGIVVEREAKEIKISSITLLGINAEHNTAEIEIECSKGTYIRSLCYDIGKKLGCGACMGKLVRMRVGQFSVDDSLTLEQVAGLVTEHRLEETMLPADVMFPYPQIFAVSEAFNKLLMNGNVLSVKNQEDYRLIGEMIVDTKIRMYESSGRFAAIYQYNAIRGDLHPITMFTEIC